MARGRAEHWADDVSFLTESYREGRTDEFVEPTGIRGAGEEGIGADDVVILMNFRADRMRQITAALADPDFDGFERDGPLPAEVITMTEYEDDLPVTVAFQPGDVSMGLSEFLAGKGLRQLKVAETEKYAHVTYFFNGGEEKPWAGEDRVLIPSPKVATYDLQPEMSAGPVCDAVVEGLGDDYDFILVNFANPDMVGHTGVIPAAVEAVETVDRCLGRILERVAERPEWVALVTADHGNCEKMLNEDGSVHTAHTTEPVDFMVYDPLAEGSGEASEDIGEAHARRRGRDGDETDAGEGDEADAGDGGEEVPPPAMLRDDGRLADVAPTVLGYMGIEPPEVMDGRDLVTNR
jgi:2,3-bisphosphoglycerate-independent phosphoglycerate mutase